MELLTNTFRQLLSMSLTALPVMAVVFAVRLLLQRAPKKYSYWLWAAVWFRLVCPLAVKAPWSMFNLQVLQPVAEQAETALPAAVPAARPIEALPTLGTGLQPVSIPTGDAAAQTGLSAAETALRAAAAVWAIGLLVLLICWTVSYFRLRRGVSTAVWQGGNVWECDTISTPFVLGLVKPRIYIPFRMDGNQRTYVLAHERYHIRQKDHWAKPLTLLVLAAYWWNPGVWLCWALFCRDMEMRCDEAVLEELGDQVKAGYSLSLVSFALDRRFPAALAFGEHDAARRVKHVLAWRREGPRMAAAALLAVTAVWLVCSTDAKASASWLKAELTGEGVSVVCNLKEPIRAWAIYEDIYENGELIYSEPRIMDTFQSDGGASPRDLRITLTAFPTFTEDGGFSGTLNCSFAGVGSASWETTLPKERYTGMGSLLGDGSKESGFGRGRHTLENDGSMVLYSILLSTEPNGSVTTYHRELGVAGSNDTAVQFRLVTSTGTADFQGLSQPLEEAENEGAAVSRQPFTDILGYDGVLVTDGRMDSWSLRTYYAGEGGETFPIAESFGWGPAQDYTVDLDGDGQQELVCNVEFGGDGAMRVIIYQRREDGIYQGWLDPGQLPGHNNWGINSTWEEYDPAENVFRIHYDIGDDSDGGVWESQGLENIAFRPYAP